MLKEKQIADYDNSLIIQTASDLTKNCLTNSQKIEKIFYYVRDDIKFGFTNNGDFVTASNTITLGYGQCNNKSNLFITLCKAINIPARIHFSLIKREIQKGLFTGLIYQLMPKEISHSWIEVLIEKKWIKIDSFINDFQFFKQALKELEKRKWDTGYSVSCSSGSGSADFSLEENSFVQMGAVTDDHGFFDEPMDYYLTANYKNRPNRIRLFIYRLSIGSINRKVKKLRNTGIKNESNNN